MDKKTVEIAKTSLDFLLTVFQTETTFHPISSLPYPKEEIRNAIKKYYTDCTMSEEEHREVMMKYLLLANFLDDEDAQFMNTVDKAMVEVDINDIKACREWTKNPKNNEDFKKYTTILPKINIERNKLNDELVSAYAECIGNSKKKVDPLPSPSDSAQTLP